MSRRYPPWRRPRRHARPLILLREIAVIASIAGLAACGSEPTPVPAPGVLQLGSATQSLGEAGGSVTITITRTGGSDGAVSATLTTSDGTAIAGQDFTSSAATVAFAAGDAVSKTVDIAISDDAVVETDETLTVTLSAATGGATLGAPASAVITIQDNDTVGTTPAAGNALNDTGVTTCANGANNGVACNSAAAGTDQYPDQDAEHGLDFTANDDSDGRAGFSFTKLDGAGAPLANQQAAYDSTPWDCVRDNVTGLTWEVKTDDGGLHDRDWTYSWYNSSGINTGLSTGMPNGGSCLNGADCDTEKYAAAVNAARWCGQGDWRLPSRAELLSIVNYDVAAAPRVDSGYFPNAAGNPHWSASPGQLIAVWAVDFATGDVTAQSRSHAYSVRLVRAGP